MMFDKLNCQRCFKKWAGFLVVEMNFGQVNWVCLEGNQPSVVTHNHWDSPVSPELSCCCYHVRRRPLILLFWLLLTTFLPLFGKVLTDFLPSFVYFVSILRLFLMHFDYFWKLKNALWLLFGYFWLPLNTKNMSFSYRHYCSYFFPPLRLHFRLLLLLLTYEI